jgi:hypothetical protein
MHILITVNAAWNVLNFQRPIVAAMIADGHRVTVLAPRDDSVAALEGRGCKVLPLEMSVKGLNPLQDIKLIGRMRKVFRAEKPDAIFNYTIKNNIFGALAARPLGIPIIPNVTGLGTAFLSGGFFTAHCGGSLSARLSQPGRHFFPKRGRQGFVSGVQISHSAAGPPLAGLRH